MSLDIQFLRWLGLTEVWHYVAAFMGCLVILIVYLKFTTEKPTIVLTGSETDAVKAAKGKKGLAGIVSAFKAGEQVGGRVSKLSVKANELVKEYLVDSAEETDPILLLTYDNEEDYERYCRYQGELPSRVEVNELIAMIHQLLIEKGYRSVVAPFNQAEYVAIEAELRKLGFKPEQYNAGYTHLMIQKYGQ